MKDYLIKEYTKKPIKIKAVLYDGSEESYEAIKKLDITNRLRNISFNLVERQKWIPIETLEGTMACNIGDYLIQGIKGELYPCKPDIFTESYREATKLDFNSEYLFVNKGQEDIEKYLDTLKPEKQAMLKIKYAKEEFEIREDTNLDYPIGIYHKKSNSLVARYWDDLEEYRHHFVMEIPISKFDIEQGLLFQVSPLISVEIGEEE
ncbi:MAG: hypothetical protein FWE18_00075 [Alphaproteobacteria bacterium]|nr:hypothetical protein [Alphaproteobacteria bacterium]